MISTRPSAISITRNTEVVAVVPSLFTGLVQSLGTLWGLFRHYWILAKLAITILYTILLLVHMEVW